MLALLLALTMGISFPFCLFRIKKFNISLKKMLLIYIVFSMVGLVGACVGSFISGGSIEGRRLYGLMLFDTIALLIMSKLLRIEIGQLGDFIAVPIMATCVSAKIDCLMNNCCRGFVMNPHAGESIRFPSAIIEMVIWSIFVVLLLLIERKRHATGVLWPISLIWFGTVRYLVDFFREGSGGSELLLGLMSGAQFWSLIALLIGLVFLFVVLRKKSGHNPTIGELCKTIFGMQVIPYQTDETE